MNEVWKRESSSSMLSNSALLLSSSTMAKRQHLWVCWQEPESDRGKYSLIPSSWIAKCLAGDCTTAGSLVRCRWPRSDELFTAKIINDPSPGDLVNNEVMDVPTFVDNNNDGGGGGADFSSSTSACRKMFSRRRESTTTTTDQQQSNSSSPATGKTFPGSNFAAEDGGIPVLNHLKRFFITEFTKISGELQANFDIMGHRIGALEVNMKCVRERVERIENILNTAAHEFVVDTSSENFTSNSNSGRSAAQQQKQASSLMVVKNTTSTTTTSRRRNQQQQQQRRKSSNIRNNNLGMENEDEEDGNDQKPYQRGGNDHIDNEQEDEVEQILIPRAVVIPRANEQRPRKDRNPRPRAVVVTCPKNRNIVYLAGDERFRMPLQTYLDAIRHAKRPTATYMVTALLRRYLPAATLARLCVNERQLSNTKGGEMVDQELLDVLKKQGRMQFPQTSMVDRELLLRIEDVARDVRRKLKLKKAGISTTSSRRSTSGGVSSYLSGGPISMVTSNRPSLMASFPGPGMTSSTARTKGLAGSTATRAVDIEDGGQHDAYNDYAAGAMDEDEDGEEQDEAGGVQDYQENPQALPMFS